MAEAGDFEPLIDANTNEGFFSHWNRTKGVTCAFLAVCSAGTALLLSSNVLRSSAASVGSSKVVRGVGALTATQIFGEKGISPDDVIRSRTSLYDVDDDIDAHDVYQGELGDCYMDAAIASIAHKNPMIIEGMFVDRQGWRDDVYTLRWYFGGQAYRIAINDMVPTSDQGRPFFLWTSSQLSVWPALIEKSYAKIYGNYHRIEGGFPDDVFKAITGMKTYRIYTPQADQRALQKALIAATEAALPMCCSTYKGAHGISGGHAYSLMEAREDYEGYGFSVRVRNPWGVNKYTGQIPVYNGHSVGDFWCTFQEFLDAFILVYIATVPEYYAQRPAVDFTTLSEGSANLNLSAVMNSVINLREVDESRLPELDNFDEIENGEDSMFPETLSSIADPGENCGDTAHGYNTGCGKFNHWKSIKSIVEGFEDGQKCATYQPDSAKCDVSNSCDNDITWFCAIIGCDFEVTIQSGYYYSLPAKCCNCQSNHYVQLSLSNGTKV